MLWVSSPEFEARTEAHLAAGLASALAAGKKVIITHARRLDVAGRTTYMLAPLVERHGLHEVTLLQPEDAPHNKQGFAVQTSAAKQIAIAALLMPHKNSIVAALENKKALVAGNFARMIMGRLDIDMRDQFAHACIAYPCWWSKFQLYPVIETHAKLASILALTTPTLGQVKKYIVVAHNQALRDREDRLSPEEKLRRSEEARQRWDQLPQAEKLRRSEEASSSMELVWERMGLLDKLARIMALTRSLRTMEGKKKWVAKLTQAWKKWTPQQRVARMANMRKGYREKMTPEKQAATGQKRKLAWTDEMKSAASERGSTAEGVEQAKTNLASAHKKLKEPEAMANRTAKNKQAAVEKHVKTVTELLKADPLTWTKADRRQLCTSSQRWLNQDGGEVALTDLQKEKFEEAVKKSKETGAALKSEKLKSRHQNAREQQAAASVDG